MDGWWCVTEVGGWKDRWRVVEQMVGGSVDEWVNGGCVDGCVSSVSHSGLDSDAASR